jgi:membrane-associated phospholipid phosphatase
MVVLNCLSVKIFVCLVLCTAAASAWEVREAVPDTVDSRSSERDSSAAVSTPSPKRPHFLQRLGQDFLIQARSPFVMNGTQAGYVAAGLGITAGLIAIDEPIDRSLRHLKANHSVIRTTSPILTDFGGTYGILTGVAYAGYSVIWDDDDAKETSLLITEALITSGVWTRIGKMIAGRERPSAAYDYSHDPGGKWSGPLGTIDKRPNESVSKYDAFPSGHTATAFAIATVFAKRYSESSYVPILSYSLATIVGITRMIEHTHWASDVFAGACIGYLCGDQVVSHYEKTDAVADAQDPAKKTVRFSIGMINDAPALQLAVGF